MSNKECDIVQDLLPLYYDNACSEESRRFVEKHLPGCNDCQKMYNELKENNVDEVLAKESKGVLERHAKIERNAAYKAGVVIAAILLLPIVITFIVQLATGMGLGVFSVVTASMMLVAALTVVPLMSTNNRLKEVEVVMRSEALLIGNKNMSKEKKEILDELLFRMDAVKTAEDKKYVLMNAPKDKLEDIIAVLPGMKSPTVMPLAQDGWCSVHTVLDEKRFWEIIGKLKALGAEGILVLPIEKMII